MRRAPKMPLRAPLVVTVVARARQDKIVDLFEQRLSARCAVMAMQMAAVALGFGGIWRSGWPMFSRDLHSALDLSPDDQIVGFLYLGTLKKRLDAATPANSEAFVRFH